MTDNQTTDEYAEAALRMYAACAGLGTKTIDVLVKKLMAKRKQAAALDRLVADAQEMGEYE